MQQCPRVGSCWMQIWACQGAAARLLEGSGERTWEGFQGRGDGGHHGGFAVAAQGVFQDARQLGVPVGDVRPHAPRIGQR